MASTVISIITKVEQGFSYFQRRSENDALSEVRRQNNYCLHILVKGGFLGDSYHDKSGDKDVNASRGVFFSSLGRTFHHPDPFFTPDGVIEWLVRSEWKDGGLNAENARFPVVSAKGAGYDGFWWRQLAGDKGGGDTRVGFCRLCAAEKKNIEAL